MTVLFPSILVFVLVHGNLAFQPLSSLSSSRARISPLVRLSAETNTDGDAVASSSSSIQSTLQRGVEIMDRVMTPEFMESSPSLKKMYSQIVKNVEIKESSIPNAGRGLFAKKNIKAGTIVSFYPAHALGIDLDDDNTDGQPNNSFVSLPQDADHFQSHPSSDSSYLHCTDQPLFRRPSFLGTNDIPLYLDVNPHKPIVPGWVSQMINDGAVVQANSEQGVLDYYQATGKAKNCIHIPWGPSPVMATVTTKKVKKGQELLTSYGSTYWLGVWLNVHGEQGVGITPEIQAKIQDTARDLLASMQTVSVTYAQQTEAMEEHFAKLLASSSSSS